MANVNITINDTPVAAEDGITILDVAVSAGIEIPTLCFMKGLDPHANCRICVVEVEGIANFMPACATKITEGMVVQTDTPDVRQSRKNTLELLLARHSVDCHHCLRIGSSKADDLDPVFCEMCFFCDCVRDGFCELQALAREYKVSALPYELEPYNYPVDTSTGCIVLNPNKCIKCLRCVDVCRDVQSVHALSSVRRGAEKQISPAMGVPLSDTPCVMCGRCVEVCPTGATHVLEQKDELLYQIHDYETTTIAQVSDDVLDELAQLSKIKRWCLEMGHVVAGLKKIGVDHVVSEKTALSIGREAAVRYLEKNAGEKDLPVIITSSHAAQLFVNQFFPVLSEKVFCYNSAQQQFGRMIREKQFSFPGLTQSGQKICTLSITANNDNEGEATKSGSVDYVLNARELYRIFLRCGVNLEKIRCAEPEKQGDSVYLPPSMEQLFAPVAWTVDADIEEIDLEAGSVFVKAAVGKTLGHARQLLEQVESGSSPYQVIKISS